MTSENLHDGLLYCEQCHKPKQFRLPVPIAGRDIVSCLCDCEQKQWEHQEEERKQQETMKSIARLKANGIHDSTLLQYTFAQDQGVCMHMPKAKRYVSAWKEMYQNNCGLLLWGDVGTGKSFFAACIANALLEKQVPVLMTNFSKILNTLSATFSDEKNAFINSLSRYALLIIDDLGIERSTPYALEQVWNVIDCRYKSGKPLIITTNLLLTQFKNGEDIAHTRIYSRVLEMCVPIQFTGDDLRKKKAEEKLDFLKKQLS